MKFGNFLSVLTLIFITLKLLTYIDWSWWWVLAPIWIPLSITFIILTVLGIVWLSCILYTKYIGKK